MAETTGGAAAPNTSLTKTAVGLAVLAVVVWVALAATGTEGAIWLVVAAIGLGAAVTGWMAGHGSRQNMPALIALVVGVLGVITVVAWGLIVEL